MPDAIAPALAVAEVCKKSKLPPKVEHYTVLFDSPTTALNTTIGGASLSFVDRGYLFT